METLEQTIEKANQAGISAAASTGLEFNPLKTTSITSSNLQPQQNFQVATLPPATGASGLLGEIEGSADTFVKDLETRSKQTEQSEQRSFESLVSEALATPGQTELTAKAEKEAGLDALNLEVKDISDQIRKEQLALRRRTEEIEQNRGGLLAGAVQDEINRARSDSLKRQADLYVIQQGVQGRYDSAKAIADRAVSVQMEQSQRKLQLLQLNYERNKDLFTKSEQRLFETKQADRERKLEQEEQNKKDIYTIGITAGQNGGGAQLMQSIFAAKTPEEAARLGANYLSNPLDRQLKDLQLRKARVELDQVETANEALKDPKWGSIINQTASLVGSERGKQIRSNMAGYIANGNYKSAWAEVTNAVEEKLTGENATKFGNQITDHEAMKGLRNAVQAYADGGGDMGLLVGKAEDISNRLAGVTSNPKLTTLATQLNREFQTYRTNATGAAFSPGESREYAKVNPRSTASLDLNLAVIDGALNQLENRITSTVSTRVPGAESLWQINNGQTESDYLDAIDEALKTSSDPLSNWINSVTK